MSKIKVVQIAMGGNDQEFYCEYLDDKGRVWHDLGKSVRDEEHPDYSENRPIYKWVSQWEMIPLPDEPKETEKQDE